MMRLFKLTIVVALTVILAFFGSSQPAAAQTPLCDDISPDSSGMGCYNDCMDDLFPGNLNCTANDVRVSGVADVTGDGRLDEDDITFGKVCDFGAQNAGDPCDSNPSVCLDGDGNSAPSLCVDDNCAFEGDTTRFAATFIVELSAQARYDIGLYFEVTPDLNSDGALTGDCWIGTLPETGTGFIDLDTSCTGGNCPQPTDTCGDIDDSVNPIYYDLSANNMWIETTCIANDNGKLNLPNCTSWRQSGANELCDNPQDAYPGSPSKCNCQPEFEVPIEVPPAKLLVVKKVSKDGGVTFFDSVDISEPGATVVYRVSITNNGVDPNNSLTLNNPNGLLDSIYGDITTFGHDGITTTTCSVPQIIDGAGGSYTCQFTVNIAANKVDYMTAGINDTVTASGVDTQNRAVSGSDDATVNILDVLPKIDVTKDTDPANASVAEPGGDVTFLVVVYNNSPADVLKVTSLIDDTYGDIAQLEGTTCSVPQDIAIGGSYSCSFVAYVSGNSGDSAKVDEVTATGNDDEGTVVTAKDTASVSITDVGASIEVIKTVSTNGTDFHDSVHISEPGQQVTLKVQVNNTSKVDYLTVTDVFDTRPYPGGIETNISASCLDEYGASLIGQTIAPGGSVTCTFTADVTGEPRNEDDLAKICADDDDAVPNNWCDDDTATVIIDNVPPDASLNKTVKQMIVTYEVTVYNNSTVESLYLDDLVDDPFGDITYIHDHVVETNCVAGGQEIVKGGSYKCTFSAKITTSPHADRVTGEVSDNDGYTIHPFNCAEVTFGDSGSCTAP